YEIAGGSHADGEGLARTGEVISRDFGVPPLPECSGPLSPLDAGPVHRSSLTNLLRWIDHGIAPPPSRLIDLDEALEVVRDGFGNALGGIRLPPIAVPLGSFAPGNAGPLPCPLAGTFTAFDGPTLEELYPSHGPYLSAVARSANDNARQGYILRSDAVRYVVDAAKSGIGR
ncbi:MAG: hypothetical protein KDD47_23905, partial [Acidobacteria bacterium]|nr:hypothetical protein [Acidobacteriota bacterium]